METKPDVELQFGNLEMLFVEKPFDKALAEIKAAGGQLATAQQVAQARIVGGKKHHVSQYGSWTAENFVYFPGGKVLATYADYSPILKHPTEATDAHRNGEEFYISKDEAKNLEEMAKEDSRKKPSEQRVYTFDKTKSYEIPVSKFAKNDLAQFMFKEADAQKYAKFLQEAGIKEVPVWLVDSNHVKKQKAPFARPLWFRNLDNRSVLDGGDRDLDCSGRARGVRVASEASTHPYVNLIEKYGIKSERELKSALELYEQAKKIVT
jgi:hypothetical protein